MILCCLFQKTATVPCYDHLFLRLHSYNQLATLSLFQEVIRTLLVSLCSSTIALPVLPTKVPVWNPLLLSNRNLVFLMSNSDLLNPALGGSSLCTLIKSLL